jgi:putative glycosyltransferase (TIGR04372 family)
MNKLTKIFRSPKTIAKILPVLTRNQLKGYVPFIIFSPLDKCLKLYLRYINKKSINFVPRLLSALLANYALETGDHEQALQLTKRAQRHPKSRRLAFNYEIQIAANYSDKQRDDQLKLAISDTGIREGRFAAAMLWAFWNLSLHEYANFITNVLERMEEHQTSLELNGPRLLPDFTTNMGHLGYLVSYLGFYEKEDPTREIVIWPDQSPNNFYIRLLIDQSPIKISTRPGKSNLILNDPSLNDSLLFSRKPSGVWRFEHNSAVCSGQDFPELTGTNNFKLKFPEDKDFECLTKLAKIGFNPNKWFVILHIRESSQNNAQSTQARDSEIIKFIEFCSLISDLGGQVIRMGSKSFPKLTRSFQAIDYAHSDLDSDVLDCWLWANCKWWTGNSNGASLAAHAFGAPRLIIDEWYWDNFGPSSDLYLPKFLLHDGKPISMADTINHKLSRNMNMELFKKRNLSFHSNTNQEIVSATLDMFDMIRSESDIDKQELSEPDRKLSRLLLNINPSHTMRVAPSYRTKLEEIL